MQVRLKAVPGLADSVLGPLHLLRQDLQGADRELPAMTVCFSCVRHKLKAMLTLHVLN